MTMKTFVAAITPLLVLFVGGPMAALVVTLILLLCWRKSCLEILTIHFAWSFIAVVALFAARTAAVYDMFPSSAKQVKEMTTEMLAQTGTNELLFAYPLQNAAHRYSHQRMYHSVARLVTYGCAGYNRLTPAMDAWDVSSTLDLYIMNRTLDLAPTPELRKHDEAAYRKYLTESCARYREQLVEQVGKIQD